MSSANASPRVAEGVEPGLDEVDDAEVSVVAMSREEIWEYLEREAQELLGCSAQEVFDRLERGEYRGTALADEFAMFRSLLDAA